MPAFITACSEQTRTDKRNAIGLADVLTQQVAVLSPLPIPFRPAHGLESYVVSTAITAICGIERSETTRPAQVTEAERSVESGTITAIQTTLTVAIPAQEGDISLIKEKERVIKTVIVDELGDPQRSFVESLTIAQGYILPSLVSTNTVQHVTNQGGIANKGSKVCGKRGKDTPTGFGKIDDKRRNV